MSAETDTDPGTRRPDRIDEEIARDAARLRWTVILSGLAAVLVIGGLNVVALIFE